MSLPKISVGILVLNGRPFIKAQLDTLYDLSHEIIICEGGDDYWEDTHGYRRSIDGTIEIIQNYPDPDDKIKLIQENWTNKNHMSRTYSKHMTGDYVYTVDIDEFLRPEDIKAIVTEMAKNNWNAAVSSHYVFFGDFQTVIRNKNTQFWCRPVRFLKRNPTQLINHIPIGYLTTNKSGKQSVTSPGRILNADKMGIKTHHYSYVDRDAALLKFKYYTKRAWASRPDLRLKEALERFENERDELVSSNFVIRRKTHDHFLDEFDGTHLDILTDIQADLELLLNDRKQTEHPEEHNTQP